MPELEQWEKRAQAARARRAAQLPEEYVIPSDKLPAESVKDVSNFPKESGLLTDRELEITESNVPTLFEAIKAKKYTALEVTQAYIKRAAYAHQLTNCLSEMFFERGIARAKELDEIYERTGELVGPLHGIPVGIKDNHHIKDTSCGLGFTKFAEEISTKNSALVDILLENGAVIYCKSTVPMAMMSSETSTNLFGTTKNPVNRTLTVGGSSGGEGALLSLGGAAVGIGSDIGGSIRMPSSHNGLYGLKPTGYRFPTYGCRPGNAAQVFVTAVVGPMARDIDSLDYLTRVVLNSDPSLVDYTSVPVPYREQELPQKLSFAVLKSDNVVRPLPTVQRALEETIAAVKAAGHEVIEWQPVGMAELAETVMGFYGYDGGHSILDHLDGEPPSTIIDKSRIKDRHGSELAELQLKRKQIEAAVFEQWKATAKRTSTGREIDGIIAPVMVFPSHPHHYKNTYINYTSFWNVLDYPGMSFPVTQVDLQKDAVPCDFEALNPYEESIWTRYKPELYENGPAGLQVLTRRYSDEKAIALARVISTALDANRN
ncbi:hypothetical protein TRVA0_009S01200 [Trichomonascus vanleenenianus]|uniref:uncharacterized protein n=1 Tax=Trichomonascus vanleenenianus TaxID=2268995 RepID=UPI003ECA2F12